MLLIYLVLMSLAARPLELTCVLQPQLKMITKMTELRPQHHKNYRQKAYTVPLQSHDRAAKMPRLFGMMISLLNLEIKWIKPSKN